MVVMCFEQVQRFILMKKIFLGQWQFNNMRYLCSSSGLCYL